MAAGLQGEWPSSFALHCRDKSAHVTQLANVHAHDVHRSATATFSSPQSPQPSLPPSPGDDSLFHCRSTLAVKRVILIGRGSRKEEDVQLGRQSRLDRTGPHQIWGSTESLLFRTTREGKKFCGASLLFNPLAKNQRAPVGPPQFQPS